MSEQITPPLPENALDLSQVKADLEKKRPLAELPAIEIIRRLLNQFIKTKAVIHSDDSAYTVERAAMELAQYLLPNNFAITHFLYTRITAAHGMGHDQLSSIDSLDELATQCNAIRTSMIKVLTVEAPRLGVEHIATEGWSYFHRQRQLAGETRYRVYLSPDAAGLAEVIHDLISAIPQDTTFRAKSIQLAGLPSDYARGDKIVLYLSDQNASAILKALVAAYSKNKHHFAGRYAPGGGTYSPLPGVSITKYRDKKSGMTGTEHIAHILEQAFSAVFNPIALDSLRSFSTIEAISHSPISRVVWEVVVYLINGRDTPESRLVEYDNHLKSFFAKGIWYAVLKRATQQQPLTQAEFAACIARYVQDPAGLDRVRALTQEQVNRIMHDVLLRVGMYEVMRQALKNRDLPGDALRERIADSGLVYDPAKDSL